MAQSPSYSFDLAPDPEKGKPVSPSCHAREGKEGSESEMEASSVRFIRSSQLVEQASQPARYQAARPAAPLFSRTNETTHLAVGARTAREKRLLARRVGIARHARPTNAESELHNNVDERTRDARRFQLQHTRTCFIETWKANLFRTFT